MHECVFVSVSVYARVKFRIVLSFFRVKQGMQHVVKKRTRCFSVLVTFIFLKITLCQFEV